MNKNFPRKAMLLAAGLGERLRPLTLEMPKPLIPIARHSLIEYNLALLNKFGIKEVMINLHYLGEQIENKIGKKYQKLKIFYSKEEEILGTAGGIKKAEFFFEGEAFFLLNADILIDLDLIDLFHFHQNQSSSATLAVTKADRPDVIRSIFVNEQKKIIDIGEEKQSNKNYQKTIFTGAQLIEPEIFSKIPEHKKSGLIEDAYLPLLQEGKTLSAYLFDRYWRDVGSFERYEKVKEEFKNGWPYTTLKPEDLI